MESTSYRPDVGLPRGGITAICQPKAGSLRARKVVSRSKTFGTGKYPSWKLNRMVQWESVHELNALRLLDANPAVLGFREQPVVIEYTIEGQHHLHVPDIEVRLSSGKELWEVKTRADALSEEISRRTKALTAWLKQFGYTYRVVVGEDLRAEPRLSTVRSILRHGRRPINAVAREKARRLLDLSPSVSWGAVSDGALGSDGRTIACRLLLEGALTLDFSVPLTSDTLLFRSASSDDSCSFVALPAVDSSQVLGGRHEI